MKIDYWKLTMHGQPNIKRPKHVGAIINNTIVQQFGIKYEICNKNTKKMYNIQLAVYCEVSKPQLPHSKCVTRHSAPHTEPVLLFS
jgi:hypothetical protein